MHSDRRALLANTLGLAASWLGSASWSAAVAQPAGAYPNRLVKLVVPYPAGIPIDVLLRSIALRLSDVFKQPVIVENKPGAGANIGIEYVARSPADGYTILSTSSNFVANPALYSKVNYDPLKDFTPVIGLIKSPSVLMVAGDSPIQSVADLIAQAKAKPDALKYASGGNGTLAHFAAEMFKSAANIQALHVPYKGSPEIMTSLLSRITDFSFPVAASTLGQLKSGKFRALAVTAQKRMALLPDVPTMQEAMKNKGFELESENGLVVPAGTANEVVQRLYQEIARIMRDPAIADPVVASGYEIVASAPSAFGASLRSDIGKYNTIIKQIDLKLD